MTDKTNVTPLASAKSPEKAASGKSVAAAANAAQKVAPAAQAAPEAKSAPAPAVKAGSTGAAVETKKAAHEMDPDPDGRYAAHHAEHLRERGTRALERLTQTEAATPDELRGKARVAALLIAGGHGALEEEVGYTSSWRSKATK